MRRIFPAVALIAFWPLSTFAAAPVLFAMADDGDQAATSPAGAPAAPPMDIQNNPAQLEGARRLKPLEERRQNMRPQLLDENAAPVTQPTTAPAAADQPANPPAEEVIQGGGIRIQIIDGQRPDILVVPDDNMIAPATQPTTGPAAEGQPVNPPAEEVIQGGGLPTGIVKRVRRLPANRGIKQDPPIGPATLPTTLPTTVPTPAPIEPTPREILNDANTPHALPDGGAILPGGIPVYPPHPRVTLKNANESAPLGDRPAVDSDRPVLIDGHVPPSRGGRAVFAVLADEMTVAADPPTTAPVPDDGDRPVRIDAPVRINGGRMRMPHRVQGPIDEPNVPGAGTNPPTTAPAADDAPATQPTPEDRAKMREKLRRNMQLRSLDAAEPRSNPPATQPTTEPAADNEIVPPPRVIRPRIIRGGIKGPPQILVAPPDNVDGPATQPAADGEVAQPPRPIQRRIIRGGIHEQPRILVAPPDNVDGPATQPATKPTTRMSPEERAKLREKLRRDMQFKSLDAGEPANDETGVKPATQPAAGRTRAQ